MNFSEYVSLGHPDKIADYISQYLLDRYIERDADSRYAVEVQIKNNKVTLGGEVSSKHKFTNDEITEFVKKAVNEIGYTRNYMEKWGEENTICGDILDVSALINQQSPDIAQGLSGWGDQGIFFGYCKYSPTSYGMAYEHFLAKRLCKMLFDSGIGGLDIKTQVVTENNKVVKVIVAIPLLEDTPIIEVEQFVKSIIQGDYELIINGTGRYVQHSTIADCGTTGRKLAVDFYGGACKIGGGCPWTKDGSKADLTLNILARNIAVENAIRNKCDAFVSLACCIGKQEVDYCVTNKQGETIESGTTSFDPQELRKKYKLDTPIFASMCRWGLFGEYQDDKEWESFKYN